MKRTLSLLLASVLSALPCSGLAALRLAAPFSDGAVLQRHTPVPVWGLANPGDDVRVAFAGQERKTRADQAGRWRVELKPMPANATPGQLIVTASDSVTVQNVLVGEVWLCSGQSNMNMPLKQAMNSAAEIAAANHPLIRHFTVKSKVSDDPVEMADGEWQVCTPETAAGFSATGYFFGRELQRQLGVPIGLIKSTLGGSPVEGWLSEEALASDPAFAVVAERWLEMKPRIKGDSIRNQPGGLYNGFIYPLRQTALAGFLWYQGEGNAERAGEYERLFSTMIRQWRRDFGQGDLPFLFAQLPKWTDKRDATGESWAWLRDAQTRTAAALPRTWQAVLLDVGQDEDLHPVNKQEAGRRLALLALVNVYKRKVDATGPVFVGMKRKGSALQLSFKHADELRIDGDPTLAFSIAGQDRIFVPAAAEIRGSKVRVSSPKVPTPVAVRFEWQNSTRAYLRNASGLPAAPFRTDDWPRVLPVAAK